MEKDYLTLKRASIRTDPVRRGTTTTNVLAEGAVVGRIFKIRVGRWRPHTHTRL
jgi:hypothetical protein